MQPLLVALGHRRRLLVQLGSGSGLGSGFGFGFGFAWARVRVRVRVRVRFRDRVRVRSRRLLVRQAVRAIVLHLAPGQGRSWDQRN